MAARACDSCKGSPAVLFCRPDSAFLCGACDVKVHGANKFASRHERVLVCDVCEQAPAAFTCKADAAALCASCDSDIHAANPLARRHERFPVVPFYGESRGPGPASINVGLGRPEVVLVKPDVDEEDGRNGVVEPASIDLEQTPELETVDYFFSRVDPYTEVDYVSSMDAMYDQAEDHIVPVQSMSADDYHPAAALDRCIEFDLGKPKPSYAGNHVSSLSRGVIMPARERSETTFFDANYDFEISSTDVGVVPDASATAAEDSNPYGAAALGGREREARLMRYREKRKNRKFEKTIRYASRKAYAETRPRIKGRFAKTTGMTEADSMRVATAGFALEDAADYGVVPSL